MNDVPVPQMFDSTVSLSGLLGSDEGRCAITELPVDQCACAQHRNIVDDLTPPLRIQP